MDILGGAAPGSGSVISEPPVPSAGGGKIREDRLGGGGLTWGGTAGSASPARSCRKQVNSLMAGIFSDVPSQGAPRENHHARTRGEPLAQEDRS